APPILNAWNTWPWRLSRSIVRRFLFNMVSIHIPPFGQHQAFLQNRHKHITLEEAGFQKRAFSSATAV
ncbi:MAG: hypothetical protein P8Y83_08555, partial [Gammaproteobacteria bacterium]